MYTPYGLQYGVCKGWYSVTDVTCST